MLQAHDLPPVLGPDAWERCWRKLGASAFPTQVHGEVVARYSESHRAYHTLQHLQECLTLHSQLAAPGMAPAEIDIALWFHDAIYQPARDDNELRSAKWLDEVAAAAGVDRETRHRLHDLVMVTRLSTAAKTSDEALLVDIDLSILGAPPERFAEYETQVRREYRLVPEWIYRRKRREILIGFRDRPSIYSTPECRDRFETQARRNLDRSIASLE
jgi:predicted metal-dependent HD superfamily phosphohydrolase